MYSKLTIAGYVGNISELKYTQDGVAVVNFSVAVNKVWNDASGNRQERVTWYRVACWRRQAEVVAQYVTKGKLVLVEGDEIKATTYTGQDGQARASLEVTANLVRFMSGKTEGESSTPPSDANDIPF
ncbi:MAG: single-stranded DNA-binding protein [Chloroflexota bacterium]